MEPGGYWQHGPVVAEEWKGARWIAFEPLPDSLLILPGLPTRVKEEDSIKDVLPLLRKTFTVPKKIKTATLFISGLGQFCASLNGKKIGDHFLDPGWTMYDKHTLYVSFDVTSTLLPGRNTLGVMLGNGFYFIPGERYHKLDAAFGYPKMICRLALQYTDGTEDNVVSDTSWKAAPGPVTFSSIYGGEDYNATA